MKIPVFKIEKLLRHLFAYFIIIILAQNSNSAVDFSDSNIGKADSLILFEVLTNFSRHIEFCENYHYYDESLVFEPNNIHAVRMFNAAGERRYNIMSIDRYQDIADLQFEILYFHDQFFFFIKDDTITMNLPKSILISQNASADLCKIIFRDQFISVHYLIEAIPKIFEY